MNLFTPELGLVAWLLIGLTLFILPFLAIIDIVKSDFANENAKVVWAVVVLAMPVLGAILYFLIGTSQRSKKQ